MAHDYKPIEELISANASLASLTEEQRTSISQILGARIGEIYRDFDSLIETVTGVNRNGAEKTYDYLERAGKSVKTQLETVNGKVTGYETEINNLKQQIAKGGDTALQSQLSQLESDKTTLQNTYNQLKKQYDELGAKHQKEMTDMRISTDIRSAMERIQFKQDANTAVVEMAKESAIKMLMGMNPTYFNNAQGKDVLIFKDEHGNTRNNPDNSMNPYTAEELLRSELTKYGIVGTTKGGAGGKSTTTTTSHQNATLALEGVTTREEAVNIADKYLRDKGYQVGTTEYQQQMTAIFKDNNLFELPLQ